MKLPMWRKLGLPGPLRPRDKNGKWLNPYRIYRIWLKVKIRGGLTARKSFQRDRHAEYYAHVTVCDEWRSFENFYRWAMSHGYRDDLTIDRIDWRRGYCPENCRWATLSEQSKNRRFTEKRRRQCAAIAAKGGRARWAKYRAEKERGRRRTSRSPPRGTP